MYEKESATQVFPVDNAKLLRAAFNIRPTVAASIT